MTQFNNNMSELNDNELEMVAGGAAYTGDKYDMVCSKPGDVHDLKGIRGLDKAMSRKSYYEAKGYTCTQPVKKA